MMVGTNGNEEWPPPIIGRLSQIQDNEKEEYLNAKVKWLQHHLGISDEEAMEIAKRNLVSHNELAKARQRATLQVG